MALCGDTKHRQSKHNYGKAIRSRFLIQLIAKLNKYHTIKQRPNTTLQNQWEQQQTIESTAAEVLSCADPENYVRGGPTLTTFLFKVDGELVDPNS